jgi:hypothetical protein
MQQPLGIIRGGGHDHSQPGEVGVHRVVIPRMVRGGRVPDPDAPPEQNRHLQPATTHVLHLRDLVDDLPDRIQHEIREHEVDHRAGAGHGCPTCQPDEPPLADGGVAESLGSVLVVEPRVVLKFPPRIPIPSPSTNIPGFAAISAGEGFERRLGVGDLPIARDRRRGQVSRFGVDVGCGCVWVGRRACLGNAVGLLDLLLDLGINRIKVSRWDGPLGREALPEEQEGALHLPGFDLLTGAIGEIAHPLGVGAGAVGLALQEGRPVARPGPLHGPPRRSTDREHIVPIDSTPGIP